jgi:hypothetical protein
MERDHPLGISVFNISDAGGGMAASGSGGKLQTTLTATAGTTTINVSQPGVRPALPGGLANGEWPFIWGQKASTVSPCNVGTWSTDVGSVVVPGNTTTYSTSTAAYVSWFRIDDECFGIIAAPTVSGSNVVLQVRRGMFGTTPAAHAIGDSVYAPIYIGRLNDPTTAAADCGLRGGPNRIDAYQLRYGVAIGDAEGADWVAEQIEDPKSFNQLGAGSQPWDGYDSIWYDVSGPFRYNNADSMGSGRDPWNFTASQPFSSAQGWSNEQKFKFNRHRTRWTGERADALAYAPGIKFIANGALANWPVFQTQYPSIDFGIAERWLADGVIEQYDLQVPFDCYASTTPKKSIVLWQKGDFGTNAQARRWEYGVIMMAYRAGARDRVQLGDQFDAWNATTGTATKPDRFFFWDLGDPTDAPTSWATVKTITDANSRVAQYRVFANAVVVVNNNANQFSFARNQIPTSVLPAGVELYDVSAIGHTGTPPTTQTTSKTILAKDASIFLRSDAGPSTPSVPAYTRPWLGTQMRWGTSIEGDPVGIYSAGGTPSNAQQRLAHLESAAVYDEPFKFIRRFRSWDDGTWDTAAERSFASRGLWLSEKARTNAGALIRYDTIAEGDHDAHIRARADEIKSLHAQSPIPRVSSLRSRGRRPPTGPRPGPISPRSGSTA